MPENNHRPARPHKVSNRKQRGVAAVEFAILAIVFFTFVFGALEMARVIYLFNILQEVTRRAGTLAANSGFDKDSLDKIRSRALFSDKNGNLVFGAPVTPSHLKIEYLSISRDGTTGAVAPKPISSMPSCPAQNYANCLTDPYGSSCVRLIRVQLCQPDGDGCTPVPYQMQFPLIDLSGLSLPRSETIVPVHTLGHDFGTGGCS